LVGHTRGQAGQRSLRQRMAAFDHPERTSSGYRCAEALAAAAELLADHDVRPSDAEAGGLTTVLIFRWLELVRDQWALRVRGRPIPSAWNGTGLC
jgi:hypothetical protein